MRMPVIAVWAAVLLTYGVSTGTAMDPKAVAGPSARAVIILGDAPDSVDDMYQDCKVQMYQKLQEYLANETKTSQTFKDGWESSEQYQQNPKNLKPPNMKEQHIVAIHCYTNNSNGVYRDFNTAVRTQGPQYKTTFRYHALHFLLTDAIQTLKGEEKVPCVTVYRRTGSTFEQDGTEIRFSSFTSTSMGNYTDKDYGNKTCFKIYTCFGADISMYSAHPEEREVLIPPYEVFKVVGVKKRSQYKDFPCEVEYGGI
ncbi:ecto-ADP-ribosyltransferase 5-like [Epinephelus fuscoguttatus]|uniref:ecto-ADP-ribosyltransferase 5-like n=1 Tax=Epinephelus fuscoguttatus TaxID=293821 RepID=UPI0020D15FE2|nr:ecto-ADP-ribosyltransferase 5-like [Epinephelus fuscoguttatus]